MRLKTCRRWWRTRRAWRLRPCLVLGLGGTAGRVLGRLRQRWSARFGDPAAMPALQMLLVDSDSRGLAQARAVEDRPGPRASETLAMPLRDQEEYYRTSQKYMKWLRRRWLSRIPRSHLTEGLRPWAALAIVDHVRDWIARLKAAISTVTSPAAIAVFVGGTSGRNPPPAPRIILVASISGGTGSGMLLDAAYAVRKALADAGVADAQVQGVLLHSTGRSPTRKAAGSGQHLCLSPRIASVQWPAGISPQRRHRASRFRCWGSPLDSTRVVHLGDGLDQAEFDQAAERMGHFLDLDTTTPGSVFFDSAKQPESPEITVRTFGLSPIGDGESAIEPEHLKDCCWRGTVPSLEGCGGSSALGSWASLMRPTRRYDRQLSSKRGKCPRWPSIPIVNWLSDG